MEEILASIRRIISEDDAPAEGQAPVAEAAAPEPVPAPAAAAPVETESPALMDETPSVQAPAEEEVLELTEKVEEPAPLQSIGDLDVAPRYEAPAEPAPEPAPAFVAPTPQFQSTPTNSAGGTTIEELVRSMLEPQIRAWADQNLDAIMRETVKEIMGDAVKEKLDRVFK